MGYKFKDSGLNGIDVVVVTKKGETEGGLPKGVIIPIGNYQIEERKHLLQRFEEEHRLNSYVAKHCDDENILTHIQPFSSVNRFGIFYTKEKMPDTDWCLDVAVGSWVRRKTVKAISELAQFI